jgi:uncharacterized repeat protein (TIGR03803 family)/surface protein
MKTLLTIAFTFVVFTISAQYTRLHNFAISPDGHSPQYSTLLSDGTFLYGMTENGGLTNDGTIYKIMLNGTGYVKLFDFNSTTTGNNPQGSLITDGTFLYGMTRASGANNFGTIFKIMPDGTGFTKLLDFNGAGNGRSPYGDLTYDGTYLYGMTFAGGVNGPTGSGVIFKLLPDGTGYVKLHDFATGPNGRLPYGNLLYDGTFFYGMTSYGGTMDAGVVFKIKPDGTGFTKLLDFDGPNGARPYGSLISDGTFLYGATPSGGTSNFGNIFKIRPDGSGYSNLLNFGSTPGQQPFGSLTFEGGLLYGMATVGGANGMGTLFKVTTDGLSFTKIWDFNAPVNGAFPFGSFISDGTYLYGVTSGGGTNGIGTIFKYALAPAGPPTITSFTPTSGSIGTTVTIIGTNFDPTPANNVVYFGATKATVTAATPTQLTVTVATGATYAPITVLNTGSSLLAYGTTNFTPTFSPTKGSITTSDFDLKVDFIAGTNPYAVAIGDLDGDGKADLAVANTNNATVSVFRNTGSSGTVSYATKIDLTTGINPNHVAIGDLDGDGKADLAVTNGTSLTVSVFRSTGSSGTISYAPKVDFATGSNPKSVAIGDLDGDGKADLAVANAYNTSVSVFRNTGSSGTVNYATKVDFTTGSFPWSVAIGDLDGDNKADLAVANYGSTSVSVFRNTGSSGTISYAPKVDFTTGLNAYHVATGDLDGDGKTDLAVANGNGTSVCVFRNTGSSGTVSFATKVDFATGGSTSVTIGGDLDGDGKADLAVANSATASNSVSIIRNNPVFPVTPTITSFTPTSGPVSITVTITGTNFSTTPANNTVRFNGTTSVVTASTATSITTTVPVGATTGKISVTVGGNTATSTNDFTITAPQNFITQWNLATTGSGATQLSFGTATSGTVNYTWQQVPSGASGSGSWSGATLTITGLPAGATIRLQIAPTNFQRININNGTDRNRLTQVEQWGTTAWTSMQTAFRNCLNLQITATDIPNLTGVSNMSEMFSGCDILNSPSNIGSWNTGAVTTMQRMFANTDAFNQNIGAWNTAAVTNMSEMFSSARAFNQPIGGWNTAAVTNMSGMFFYADVFNQDIGAWNTSAVTNMSDMFTEAFAFNQNIGAWNTAAVTNMASMFSEAIAFNQNISPWNTAAVTNMSGMFKFASVFNQNIGAWNTAAVTTMSQMFSRASAFNQNLSSWNTGAVTSMLGMFEQATAFNQNIGAWTLNPGVDIRFMFDDNGMNCSNYSATLIGWSANPSTPNGRTLGATGRQYGTNAVAARTNLDVTKGWTITGDTPSGTDCGSVSAPTITSFTPTSGPVGTTVTITGTNFSTAPANNTVTFNGTTAVVTASTATSITTTVPTGAATGKISVTVGGNIATSANDFTVTTSGGTVTINVEPLSTSIGGTVTKNLLLLITAVGNNLDINSITVTVQPPSGAVASVSNGSLTIDYTNISFSGKESITIRACDTNGNCAEQIFVIEVSDDITVYNAVSPEGKNSILRLENIEILSPKNQVNIYNRWGDEVFSISDYDNKTRAFAGLGNGGSKLPAGTYFYKIILSVSNKTLTGFLSLKY